MAYVSYILLVGCTYGLSEEQFKFESLLVVQSWVLLLWLFETCLQKGCFYFSTTANPPFFELMSYAGYKFVAACMIVIGDLLLGSLGSYIALVTFGALYVVFFYHTMDRFNKSNKLRTMVNQVNSKTLLLANCALQAFLLWVLTMY